PASFAGVFGAAGGCLLRIGARAPRGVFVGLTEERRFAPFRGQDALGPGWDARAGYSHSG
ncbi:MAG: hypothetical protein OXJ53_01990, partial [Gammaproteobacteria bacterium]|nr:hypothetical protein [Gammaproteobacteria bacterium]